MLLTLDASAALPLALAQVLFWALVLAAALGAPWSHLPGRGLVSVYLACCALLLALWHLRVQAAPGVAIHLSGATLLTLMFGWRLALCALAAVLLGATARELGPAANLGLNGLVEAALPVLVSYAWARAVERWLPPHFFVYVFLVAFLGAGLAVLARALAGAALLGLGDLAGAEQLAEAAIACLLTVFPEAFLTGAAITLLVVYAPGCVASFSDERYLRGR